MEETLIKESQAQYFKSATNLLEGYLVMTNKGIMFSGKQSRMKFNHGVVGNVIRDKMESAMGYDNPEEEFIFCIPIEHVNCQLVRYGLSKRVSISDAEGNEFKLSIVNKKERNSWPEEVEKAS